MKKPSAAAIVALLLVPTLPPGVAGGRGVAAAGPAGGGANGADRCLVALADTGLVLDPDPELPADDACDLTGAVRVVEADGVELNRPFLATCDLAAAFDRFEREVLQPAAERHFGRRVARIEHSGAYRCSYVAGGGRLSEHATANAIDVHAFVLDDGRSVSVLEDWDDSGPAGAFLREIGRDACRVFSAVLGPSYNRLHRDHLHFDLGPYDICSEA